MMKLAVLIVALSAVPALAEDTVLRLSESAVVMVTPDELAATLRAEASAPTAQEAQRRVNDLMRDALASARKVEGITVSTGGYTVWRNAPSARVGVEAWQAGQAINLNGADGESVLRLVGDLQQKGLVIGSLGWHLSRKSEHAARDEATKQALAALRVRADNAAAVLGMKFESFREVRLDNVAPPMIPRPMMMARGSLAQVASSQPPAAEAEDQPVSAQAEADVLLKVR